MTRLPRSRGGKTPVEVDVVVTRQNELPRVRLSLGNDYSTSRKNTDMDTEETEALIVLLQYKLAEMRGEV